MDLGLKEKRVLVLGSSTGLGYAIAKAYHEEGAIVGITSRDLKKAEEVSNTMLHSAHFACDLSRQGAGKKVVQEAIEKRGGIDILITNTGGPPKGDFLDLNTEDWEMGFQTLWLSVTESVKEALISMKKQKWGRIIFSTSTASREPIPQLTVSTGFRSGLMGLMKTISQEVASEQITVNVIMPGYTKTKRLEEFKIPKETLIKEIPAKRLGNPDEFGALAAFLGSDKAAYITGQAIACDGGLIRGIY